jgi:hypothetical protein
MSSSKSEELEKRRLEQLRAVRQRIVEIHAVLVYLQEAQGSASHIADAQARLAQALALEMSLIAQGPYGPGSTNDGFTARSAALLVVGTWADHVVWTLLESVGNLSWLV